ncbi:hypothetical protein E5790_01120 [Stenotrophomonas sp. PAMC25021]|nr:hypothetical protein E5790_01120 [Stenotrophomonas sp. PAMC25021]
MGRESAIEHIEFQFVTRRPPLLEGNVSHCRSERQLTEGGHRLHLQIRQAENRLNHCDTLPVLAGIVAFVKVC